MVLAAGRIRRPKIVGGEAPAWDAICRAILERYPGWRFSDIRDLTFEQTIIALGGELEGGETNAAAPQDAAFVAVAKALNVAPMTLRLLPLATVTAEVRKLPNAEKTAEHWIRSMLMTWSPPDEPV